MGLLSLLDDECLFHKATDITYAEKVHTTHNGKSENYAKPGAGKSQGSNEFQVHHYAGTVSSCVI